MKKQFAAIFAATAVLGVTTAFAANPFSDVTQILGHTKQFPNWQTLVSLMVIQMALSKAKTTSLVTKWLKW